MKFKSIHFGLNSKHPHPNPCRRMLSGPPSRGREFVKVVLSIIVVILLINHTVWAQSTLKDNNTLFAKANLEYSEGRYKEAAEGYTTLLSDKENGYLYYNLGNCYLKMGETGQAILNYRRAQKLTPRFADLVANLNFARQEARDKIEDKSYSQLLQTVFFWYYSLNQRELLIGFIALTFLFFLLSSLRMYTQNDTLKWLMILVGTIYLLSAGSLAARFYQDKVARSGVVVGEEIAVYSGSSAQNVVLFKLHMGTELSVEEIKDDWLKIMLPDGKIGWVKNKGIGII